MGAKQEPACTGRLPAGGGVKNCPHDACIVKIVLVVVLQREMVAKFTINWHRDVQRTNA